MDMNNARTAWTVAAVLGVIVIILVVVMAKGQHDRERDPDFVLDRGGSRIAEIRAEIAETCAGDKPYEQADCQDTLEELSDILKDFTDDLHRINEASTTAP